LTVGVQGALYRDSSNITVLRVGVQGPLYRDSSNKI
jgi:hypothetical protein